MINPLIEFFEKKNSKFSETQHAEAYSAAMAALENWKCAARAEDAAHSEYKRAWSAYAEAMASDMGVSVGDIITITHEAGRDGEMIEVKRKQRGKIIYFDVEIVGERGVPGYPKYFVIAVVRFINKSGETIGRLDDRRINLSSKHIVWEKE